MKWTEYNYLASLGPNGMVYRPMIEIEICNGKSCFKCLAMVDSGCDRTLVNAEIADMLAINRTGLNKAKVTGIAGDGVESFTYKVKIKAEKTKHFFEANVVFVPGLHMSMLLGQDNFFEKFKVRFEKNKKKFYLSTEK